VNAKLELSQRELAEVNALKARTLAASVEAAQAKEESEAQVNHLHKASKALTKQLEESKAALEDETRQRAKMSSDNRTLQADVVQMKEQMEEEQERLADLQKLLTKANQEASMWKQRSESGTGGVRSEEMEDLKRKLTVRIQDLEAQLEAAQTRASSLDKEKNRLLGELEDLQVEVERVSCGIITMRIK